MIEPIIFQGLKKLEKLNPKLVYSKLEKHIKAREKLSFKCPEKHIGIAAFYDRTFFLDEIWIGSFGYLVLSLYDESLKGFIDKEQTENAVSFNKTVIFHEYLHFLGFGNKKTSDHNHQKIDRIKNPFVQDAVYACTAQAYINKDIPIAFNGERKFMNSQSACLTCVLSTSYKDRTRISLLVSDIKRAQSVCESIDDKDFEL